MRYAVHIPVTYTGLKSTPEKAVHLIAHPDRSHEDSYMELGPLAHRAVSYTPMTSTHHCG
jgi:hypothetical protein